MRKGLERGLIIVMAAALVVLGYVGFRLYQELVLKAEQSQVAIGGPFTLTDHTGATRTEKDLLGHPSVVYFGFTYCPDVCPTELVNIAGALDQLGPKANQVRAYFITVDPERDTQKVMADFVSNLGGDIVGLTGTPEQIAEAARSYRVYYQKAKPREDGAYTVDHSGFVYIMDSQGRYAGHLGPNAAPERIAEKLRALL